MKSKIILLATLFIALKSTALIIHVPANYPSIQTAILNSSNGDTVVVSPGTYFENINFRGKKILLTSLFYLAKDTSYISSTIINGSTPSNPDTASCVVFHSGEDSTCILQGFTLTGGTGTKWTDIHGAGIYREGGGVLMDLASPTIRYNIIINNTAINVTGVASAGGGGIRIGDGNPIIENNLILNNQGKYGPGIVLNYTGARIKNNIISSNTGATSFGGGGGIWIYNNLGTKSKIIENNTIVNNASYSGGTGGIYAESASNVIIHNNIIWANSPATQIKNISSVVQATYNDVQGGYTGTGNINTNPVMDSLCFTLNAISPCIDAGDTSLIYNDLISSPNVALFPSMGTATNDMGAYGGPGAFVMHCAKTNVGISELSNSEISFTVYPNPAFREITIEIPMEKTGKTKMSVFNFLGETISENNLTSTKNVVDVSLFPSGIYFIKINSGAETIVKKIEIVR